MAGTAQADRARCDAGGLPSGFQPGVLRIFSGGCSALLLVIQRAVFVGATNIWMEGLVLSYIPDTRLLTLGVDLSSGTGATFDEWTLNVAGQPGAAGPSGPQGAPGGPTGPTRTNGHARPARHQRRDWSIRANGSIRHAGHSWRCHRSDWPVWCSGRRWRYRPDRRKRCGRRGWWRGDGQRSARRDCGGRRADGGGEDARRC